MQVTISQFLIIYYTKIDKGKKTLNNLFSKNFINILYNVSKLYKVKFLHTLIKASVILNSFIICCSYSCNCPLVNALISSK